MVSSNAATSTICSTTAARFRRPSCRSRSKAALRSNNETFWPEALASDIWGGGFAAPIFSSVSEDGSEATVRLRNARGNFGGNGGLERRTYHPLRGADYVTAEREDG